MEDDYCIALHNMVNSPKTKVYKFSKTSCLRQPISLTKAVKKPTAQHKEDKL